MIRVQIRPDDAPLHGDRIIMVGRAGRTIRQCVRCGTHWQVHSSRPDRRSGMCRDCYSVDPQFGVAS